MYIYTYIHTTHTHINILFFFLELLTNLKTKKNNSEQVKIYK